ncbi:hypothetical protein OHA70_33255 [Kribbella sp. NBC_00382]|uniref:hypothetical protein n=1 Tax=Kribbella sp. NBC_00382 TaxID=2975967 RepID=UPI002E1A150D
MALAAGGALDSLARAANEHLELGLQRQQCAWGSKNFADKICRDRPSLTQVLADANTQAIFGIIKSLRNTIHAEPHQTVGFQGRNTNGTEERVTLPGDVADAFVEHAKVLKRREVWADTSGPDVLLRATTLGDDLVPLVVPLCSKIVEIVWPVDPNDSPQPSPTDERSPFHATNIERNRLLYGVRA